ncbi:GerMN domain-containing protein [Streptomyces sp. PCS3-D2]|uniref:GerMN domain-containing protein n=1 Tax=Streptomyces sp. PCS3-D2 TaxID=1460244 RepID=UPI00044B5C5D|nr:GerMN domain-containing protein [Streptomyces sp. PCS3-D2]WKV71056.1 GerMN domain-containing protein [Streptomyces sp. PCS3-D2]
MTGRTTRARAAAATAALAVSALLLAGCGIKRTGVIESGHAAAVGIPGGKKAAVLYFVAKEGDRLVPVPFPLSSEYIIAPVPLVRLLLQGPTGPASAAGLTTALPQVSDEQVDAVAVSKYAPDKGLTVSVPFAVGGLSELARNQLVCTLGVSAVPDTLSRVSIKGTDTVLPAADCDPRR